MKTLLFGFITIVVIPLLFFITLELGLLLAGYGKSYDYFHEFDMEGVRYLQDNPVFSHQFFPAALDIIPLENTFAAEAADDLVRVFVLGGSAARGFPNPHHGFSRQLETMLTAALPGHKVEVINTAMTAINSHVVYEIAKSIPDGELDFAIIYMGNNEVVGPYGPGALDTGLFTSSSQIRLLQSIKRFRISQALSEIIASFAREEEKADLVWQGMQMFVENKLRHDDPRLETVYSNFRTNLKDTIEILQRKGAHVMVSTVAVNLKDSAPFASLHKAGLTDMQIRNWDEAMEAADTAFETARWSSAIEAYGKAAAIDPDYADTHYRLASAYLQSGAYKEAAKHYEIARDLDALRFRADSRINRTIREVADAYAGGQLTFIDTESIFKAASYPEQPGWKHLLEHVHFSFTGNYTLAHELNNVIMNALGADDHEILTEKEIARRTAYPTLATTEVMQKLLEMVRAPPFTGQSNHAELVDFINKELNSVRQQTEDSDDIVMRYEDAVQNSEVDWRMHFELAMLYEKTGNVSGMYQQLLESIAKYPHHRDSHLMMASLMSKRGEYRKEISHLETALNYVRNDQKYLASIQGRLGIAYYNNGEKQKAIEVLRQVAGNYPDQVQFTLFAYSTLIEIAKRSGDEASLLTYAKELQQYGERMIDSGREDPDLPKTIVRLLHSAGHAARARAFMDNGHATPNPEAR